MKRYLGVALCATLLLSGCSSDKVEPKPTELDVPETIEQETPSPGVAEVTYWEPQVISQELRDEMLGKSMVENSEVTFDDLRLINVQHYGFDGEIHDGEIVVNTLVAGEVSEIFKELYDAKYPIEKISRIDEYDAKDLASMEANNTSAFCFRYIEGTNTVSNHGYGFAIDINPKYNPQVTNGKVYPESSREYSDRSRDDVGMIHPNDACYNAFISRGWTWGGDWKSTKDYQHFEKVI